MPPQATAGKSGWFGSYATNGTLGGMRGLGSSHDAQNANQSSTNNSYNYPTGRKQQEATTLMLTAVGMIGGLYLLAEYRGRNKILKALKKTTAPVNQQVHRGVDRITGNK
jgi:hypothetical protein